MCKREPGHRSLSHTGLTGRYGGPSQKLPTDFGAFTASSIPRGCGITPGLTGFLPTVVCLVPWGSWDREAQLEHAGNPTTFGPIRGTISTSSLRRRCGFTNRNIERSSNSGEQFSRSTSTIAGLRTAVNHPTAPPYDTPRVLFIMGPLVFLGWYLALGRAICSSRGFLYGPSLIPKAIPIGRHETRSLRPLIDVHTSPPVEVQLLSIRIPAPATAFVADNSGVVDRRMFESGAAARMPARLSSTKRTFAPDSSKRSDSGRRL
ncbi:hypothetical protein BU26DRAFT_501846 [Trematosphaeria pertusa]|uniref:Uncharacterized protein n=1 Tax=Trematosphaeria pertusa TaxID=390896 RepID=A0A6A6IWW7_9PLEO|nr:uncharacterized protein BU26DRAFT_501846 [Trematosphaeria pertusa]KAF2253703.1 hypothetical protein BU26DRAFT_501846 [Trematosphaeria pertusa]